MIRYEKENDTCLINLILDLGLIIYYRGILPAFNLLVGNAMLGVRSNI